MNRALYSVFLTVFLDGIGGGLIMPIIPTLFREVGHDWNFGLEYGIFLSVYAFMQFFCAPILGSLSDRFGRRPILILSLSGATLDYLFMALAPSLSLLFIGRAIAGITGASGTVASSFIVDVTPAAQRARRFGQFSACAGLGFIIGPALGGVLGDMWLRAPFYAAAALNCINLAFVFFVLRESKPRDSAQTGLTPADRLSCNPLKPLRWALESPALLPLLIAFTVFAFIAEIISTVWVLYGQDKFMWNATTIGLTLATFGLFHSIAKAFVVGPITERRGERFALYLGIACDILAYVLMGLATQGWMVFFITPLFTMGGVGEPALQSLLTSRTSEDHQGRLQGVLASVKGLAAAVGPLAISMVYFALRDIYLALIWFVGAGLYIICIPLLSKKRIGADLMG